MVPLLAFVGLRRTKDCAQDDSIAECCFKPTALA